MTEIKPIDIVAKPKPKQVTAFPGTIKQCTCKNEYQDKMYGKQMRVMNTMKVGTCRCSVCGTVY